MIRFVLTRFAWQCPSCGTALELVLSVGVAGVRLKWIRSKGLVWGKEMAVGQAVMPGEEFSCALCRSEYDVGEVTAATAGGTDFPIEVTGGPED